MTWSPTQPLRLLLIDDDDVDGQLLKIYLGKISQRIDFKHCLDEDEALRAIDDEKFDLIFVDNRLALMTGVEMLEALRNHGYAGPAVLYSGVIDSDNLEQFRDLECFDVLDKGDVTINTLKTTIESAMARASNN